MWKIELYGRAEDISRLKPLAACCDCRLVAAPDGQYCLGGAAFDRMTTADQTEAKAEGILKLLNGLARLEWFEHCPVLIGERIYPPQGAGGATFYQTHAPKFRPPRSMIFEYAPPGFHSSDLPILEDHEYALRKRIISEPALADLLTAISDEITWGRLRVVYEKLGVLVSKSTNKGRWDNALVKSKYATQDELNRFKENIQDPRHSGVDAVHGVPVNRQLKYSKMTEQEGFRLVARMIKFYASANPVP